MEKRDQNIRGQKSDGERGTEAPPGTHLGPMKPTPMEALGFRQGQLFSSPDRLTLTFFMGDQVASIHFDLTRREIFFRGHNVKNMTLTQEQWVVLRNFDKLIKQENCNPEIIQSYEECLAQILPRL